MSEPVAALVAHARITTPGDRQAMATAIREARPDGTVLLETCHRVELYGPRGAVEALGGEVGVPGSQLVHDEPLTRHLVALAVGRASVIVAEDQLLHQLRVAVAEARSRGPLDPALDHLLDLALNAGRRARSWLPGRRPSLADVAWDAGLQTGGPEGPVLVAGAGEMGRLAAAAGAARGRAVVVASRTPDRARRVASSVGATAVPLDPGPAVLGTLGGVIVALSGAWSVTPESEDALVASGAWVVDLSAPAAVAPPLATRLRGRYVAIDDLARTPQEASEGLVSRLDALVDETVERYAAWLRDEPARSAARALADRAAGARAVELGRLWERMPSLRPEERAEVEAMAERLLERVLGDPMRRLRRDSDGRHDRAARELFGL